MKTLPRSFMILAVIYVLVGMAYGIHMAVIEDTSTSPAHGHLNLVGFVLGSIFAFYYHLVPSAQTRLGWVHFGLHQVAVILMFPGVIMAHSGGSDNLAKVASLLGIVATLIFGWIVLKSSTRTAD